MWILVNHAWDKMEKDGICDFMIPIVLYIDKTQVSVSGKLTIYPVQMLFSRKRQVFFDFSINTFLLITYTLFIGL
jgi:hypothetical protein